MSYEKELEYLRKEFKKSEDKFREAEREGYETDADIWQNDMENIGHQIHIHERAAKADEYEKIKCRKHVNDCKAEAFDAVLKAYDEALSEGHMADEVCNIIQKYESGEYDD